MGKVITIGSARKRVTGNNIIHASVEKTLNTKEAKSLFTRHAICIEHIDAVDAPKAAALFGADAIHFALDKGIDTGKTTLIRYCIEEDEKQYLTLYGFLVAATYHNIKILHEENDKRKRNEA